MPADVNTPSSDYTDMAEHWALPDTLLGGTLAMQDAKTTYLPQFDAESDEAYETRRKASVLWNGFGRTVYTLAGEPLRKPVSIRNGTPIDEQIADDIDLAGNDINAFTYSMLVDVLSRGKCHFIVAMPNTQQIADSMGRSLTLRDETDLQLRPYFVRVAPSAAIAWRGGRRNGAEVLDRLRVRETDTEADGQWGEKIVNFVRVYEPNTIRRYREPEGEDGEWTIVEEIPNPLGMIPLVTVYANRVGLLKAYPPLEDLAWLNLQLWQSDSDQHNILHYARVYLLALTGWSQEDADTIELGMTRALRNSNPQAQVNVVEHSGKAIEAGLKHGEELQNKMRALGTDILTPRPQPTRTATEAGIDKAEMVSQLQSIARDMERGLTQGFYLAAKWQKRKLSPEFTVEINQEYSPLALSKQPLSDIRALQGAGMLTKRTTLQEHVRYGVLSDGIDVDDELEQAQAETELVSGEGVWEPEDPPMDTEPPQGEE